MTGEPLPLPVNSGKLVPLDLYDVFLPQIFHGYRYRYKMDSAGKSVVTNVVSVKEADVTMLIGFID